MQPKHLTNLPILPTGAQPMLDEARATQSILILKRLEWLQKHIWHLEAYVPPADRDEPLQAAQSEMRALAKQYQELLSKGAKCS
jgi:hypothetical protein